jgi:ADP-ribose pyrophosphatase YjhB (NUDIX family)
MLMLGSMEVFVANRPHEWSNGQTDISRCEEKMGETPKIMCTVGSIVKKGDAILFVRQTYGNLKNMWTLPWGLVEGQKDGQIDTPEKAACREALEEGGIVASAKSLIAFQNYVSKGGVYHLMFVFLCEYISGEPTPDMRETSEAVFLNRDELANVESECDRYCYWIANKVLASEYTELLRSDDSPYRPHIGFY